MPNQIVYFQTLFDQYEFQRSYRAQKDSRTKQHPTKCSNTVIVAHPPPQARKKYRSNLAKRITQREQMRKKSNLHLFGKRHLAK
jgi:hypothetical protein